MIYALVAEQSCVRSIKPVVESLYEYGNVTQLFLIVPPPDVHLFSQIVPTSVVVVDETLVLPGLSLDSVRKNMGGLRTRAGWYLQQFLKLSFDLYYSREVGEIEEYVIWDADTVMLEPHLFVSSSGVRLMAKGRKRLHDPYFDTIDTMLGFTSPRVVSAISQYMYIEVAKLSALRDRVSSCGEDSVWWLEVLRIIGYTDISEFSEYETYAAFVFYTYPDEHAFKGDRWFLLGSDVVGDAEMSLKEISQVFSGYSRVAFERHRDRKSFIAGLMTSIYARICLMFRLMP